MAISIHQDLITEAPSDDFVKNDATNTWDAVFGPADMTEEGTFDYLEYSKTFMLNGASVNVDGVDVKTTVGSNTKFSCKYMMDEQIVKENFNVSGQDTIKSREGFGTLGYILEVTNDDTVPLGDIVYYQIRPLNPTIVHARAIQCGVENDSPIDTSGQELVHLIKKPIKYFDSCKQEAVDFEVIKGWGGQTNQEFSYQVNILSLISAQNQFRVLNGRHQRTVTIPRLIPLCVRLSFRGKNGSTSWAIQ